MSDSEKIFCQSKQNFARIVDPLRRNFVTNDEKDSVNSMCAEFLEVPFIFTCGELYAQAPSSQPAQLKGVEFFSVRKSLCGGRKIFLYFFAKM